MLKLRQFNLQLAFARARPLRKDIKNERSPVEHLAIENLLEVTTLGGGKFVVENDRIHVRMAATLSKFVRLAFADERPGARCSQLLQAVPDDLASSGRRQLRKLLQ